MSPTTLFVSLVPTNNFTREAVDLLMSAPPMRLVWCIPAAQLIRGCAAGEPAEQRFRIEANDELTHRPPRPATAVIDMVGAHGHHQTQ